MQEKAKRGEKPKNKAKGATNPAFVWVTVMIVLLFLGGIGFVFYSLFKPSSQEIHFQGTDDAIETQNSIAMTQISGSATAAISNATATEVANSTRRVELRLTTTELVQLTQSSSQLTEVVNGTVTVQYQATASANTATAAYLAPIVSQTALSANLAATEQAASTAKAELVFDATINAIQTENSLRMTQIAATAEASRLYSTTGTQFVFFPSPTAGFCGYVHYSGSTESLANSERWQAILDRANLDYRYARVIFDAFEAQNDCQGGLTPVPYNCLSLEIAVDIAPDAWGNIETLVNQLHPVIESIDEIDFCDAEGAQLRVYFFNQGEFHYWWVNGELVLEAYENGLSPEALWQLGTVDGD
jgi:hypothetical protein